MENLTKNVIKYSVIYLMAFSSYAVAGRYVLRFDYKDTAHTIRGGMGTSAPHFTVEEIIGGGKKRLIGKYSPNGVGWNGSKPLSRSVLKKVIAQNPDEIYRMLTHPSLGQTLTVFDDIAIAATGKVGTYAPNLAARRALTRKAFDQVIKRRAAVFAGKASKLFLKVAFVSTGVGVFLEAVGTAGVAHGAEYRPMECRGFNEQLSRLNELQYLRLAQAVVHCKWFQKASGNRQDNPMYQIHREEHKIDFVDEIFNEKYEELENSMKSGHYISCGRPYDSDDGKLVCKHPDHPESTGRDCTPGEITMLNIQDRRIILRRGAHYEWSKEMCNRSTGILEGYEEESPELYEMVTKQWSEDAAKKAEVRTPRGGAVRGIRCFSHGE